MGKGRGGEGGGLFQALLSRFIYFLHCRPCFEGRPGLAIFLSPRYHLALIHYVHRFVSQVSNPKRCSPVYRNSYFLNYSTKHIISKINQNRPFSFPQVPLSGERRLLSVVNMIRRISTPITGKSLKKQSKRIKRNGVKLY